jgi:hypothetical protein
MGMLSSVVHVCMYRLRVFRYRILLLKSELTAMILHCIYVEFIIVVIIQY